MTARRPSAASLRPSPRERARRLAALLNPSWDRAEGGGSWRLLSPPCTGKRKRQIAATTLAIADAGARGSTLPDGDPTRPSGTRITAPKKGAPRSLARAFAFRAAHPIPLGTTTQSDCPEASPCCPRPEPISFPVCTALRQGQRSPEINPKTPAHKAATTAQRQRSGGMGVGLAGDV